MKKILSLAILVTAIATFSACGQKNAEANTESGQSAELYSSIKRSETATHGKDNPSVLIIASSPRINGNTQQLSEEFARGAKEAGGAVETILLAEKNIGYLNEAEADNKATEQQQDDAPAIIEKMLAADIIVLASPVYYYNIDAKMKALIDRTYALGKYREMKGKEFYYITACADTQDETAMTAVNAFRGFVCCLPSSVERGMVKALGLGGMKSAKKTAFAEEAFKLGKTIK